MDKINIKPFFDQETATFTYVVSDPLTSKAAIIDSVLNYDMHSGHTSTISADNVINYVNENHLTVEWILETHVHADHLTAAHYLKNKLGGKIGIGERIKEVLELWVPIFNTNEDTPLDASQFDKLFQDNETFALGSLTFKVLSTPGHTPACVSYYVEDAVFVGDTIFMPDVGTARSDFPGGSAKTLYNSIQKIFSLPENIRVFICHDYPPQGREVSYITTIKEQSEKNILVNSQVSEEEYINVRNKKDSTLSVPRLILPSVQVNLRAGNLGKPEANNIQYLRIPLNQPLNSKF